MIRVFTSLVLLVLIAFELDAQCDSLDMHVVSSQCKSSPISFQSYDSTLSEYQWSIDVEAIDSVPGGADLGNFGGTVSRTDISFVEDNDQWFGFYIGSTAENLYRLDFGSSLENTPTVHLIQTGVFTNSGSVVDGNLEAVQVNGQWALFGVARTSSTVIRYHLGDSVNSDTSQTTAFVDPYGQINGIPGDLKMIRFGYTYYLYIATFGSRLVCYDMTTDPITNGPQAYNTINTNSLSPAANNLRAVEAVHSCDQVVVFVGGLVSDNVVRLVFDNPLNAPSSVEEVSPSFAWDNPYSFNLTAINGNYYLYAQSRGSSVGKTYRVDIGSDVSGNMSSWTTQQLPESSLSLHAENLTFVVDDKASYIFKTRIVNSRLYRYAQPHSGTAFNRTTDDLSNVGMFSIDTGWHTLGLSARDTNGQHFAWIDSFYLNPSPSLDVSLEGSCEGYASTFIVSDSLDLTSDWSWDFGDGMQFDTTDTFIEYIYNDTGEFHLQIQANGNLCDNFFEIVWTINPTPMGTFSADSSCAGVAIEFNNSSSISAGSITNYQWDFDNGDSSTAIEPVYAYTDSGLFDVTLMVSSDSGCADTTSQWLYIKESPLAEFEFANTCIGESTTFPNAITSGFSYSLFWDFGDSTTSTANQPSKVYQDTGNYTVTLVTQSANGCGDSTSQKLRISPAPTSGFNLGSSTLCQGLPVSANDESIIPSGDTVHFVEWTFGNDTTFGTAVSLSFPDSGQTLLEHQVTIGTACNSASDTLVFVNPKPLAAFEMSDSCLNAGSVFTNHSQSFNGQQITDHNWSFGDGVTSTQSNPTHTYQDSGIVEIKLTVGTDIGCSDSTLLERRIFLSPQLSFRLNKPICSGNPLVYEFENSFDPNDSLLNVSWLMVEGGDTTLSNSGAHPVLKTQDSGGTATLLINLQSEANCTISFDTSFQIFQSPRTEIIADSNCLGQFTQLNSNYSGSNYQWSWTLGDGTSSSTPSPILFYGEPGPYQVTLELTDQRSNCSRSDTDAVYIASPITATIPVDSVCADVATSIKGVVVTDTLDRTTHYRWQIDGTVRSTEEALTWLPESSLQRVTLSLESDLGCSFSRSKDVYGRNNSSPEFVLNYTPGELPTELSASATTEDNSIYSWILLEDTTFGYNSTFNLTDSGTYDLIVRRANPNGCINQRTEVIMAFQEQIDLGVKGLTIKEQTNPLELGFTVFNPSRIDASSFTYSLREKNGADLIIKEETPLASGASKQVSVPTSFPLKNDLTDQYICIEILTVNGREDLVTANNFDCVSPSDGILVYDPYPNPTSDYIYLPLQLTRSEALEINVLDVSGRVCLSEAKNPGDGFHILEIDLRELRFGAYTLQLLTETSNRTFHVIRTR